MKIIGLTGNIGSGKSLAATYFGQLGAAVIDADQIGHDIIEPTGPAYPLIVKTFGRDFLLPNGKVDRKSIAAYVFQEEDPGRVTALNQITHSLITAEIKKKLSAYEKAGFSLAIIEAALLFQSDLCELTDENWVVTAAEETRLCRAAKRDQCDIKTIQARQAFQLPEEELIHRADNVIENHGTEEELFATVQRLYQELTAKVR